MTGQVFEAFVDHVAGILEKNGYPGKRVALPLEKMYEVAHEKGLNFNRVLEEMAARGISHEKTSERLIFYPAPDGNDLQEMMAKAQEMLKTMSPDQIKQMEEMIANMSDEERADMMRQAAEMGLHKP